MVLPRFARLAPRASRQRYRVRFAIAPPWVCHMISNTHPPLTRLPEMVHYRAPRPVSAYLLLAILILVANLCRAGQCPQYRIDTAFDVAAQRNYGADKTAMLVAIVVAENGPLGRECGVGSPRHWSRQFAHDPALSCYAQINATADILDRRYRGSVAAFANPWVQPNQRARWVHNATLIKANVLKTLPSQRGKHERTSKNHRA